MNVPRMGDRRGAYMISVRIPEGKGPRRRPRNRWDDTIEVDLQAVG
jgi:hypothetical protein